jgi:hypothetical protein
MTSYPKPKKADRRMSSIVMFFLGHWHGLSQLSASNAASYHGSKHAVPANQGVKQRGCDMKQDVAKNAHANTISRRSAHNSGD